VAVLSDRRGLLATWAQPADPGLLVEKLEPFRGQVAQVVSEAGPTGFAVARRLRAAGLAAEVIAPSKTPTLPGPEDKCDRLDCRKLAAFAQKGLLSPIRVPTDREEADRQVVRLREQLVRKPRSIEQQIKASLLQHGIAEPEGPGHWSRQAVASLEALKLDAELRFRLDELMRTERHRGAVGVLRSVPGVGPVTATTFRTELPAPERFRDVGQVAADKARRARTRPIKMAALVCDRITYPVRRARIAG